VQLSNVEGTGHPDPMSVREFLDHVLDEYVTVLDERVVGIEWADAAGFDVTRLRGVAAEDIDAAIPSDWERIAGRSGGTVYRDPHHPGRQITVMPGQPAAAGRDPVTRGPYVQVTYAASPRVPLAGNPALTEGEPR
jgi:hypothetical protein